MGAKQFRSKVSGPEFKQSLARLGMTQQGFARLTCVPRESVCAACNRPGYISVTLALALRLAEVITGLRAIINDRKRRPGWHKVKAILTLAEDRVVLQKRKPGRKGGQYRPQKPKVPTPIQIPQPIPMPTLTHAAGPAPKGYHYRLHGFTWMLERDRPDYDRLI
jgi:hypothetical protein